jgi:CofD-related protein of GAK system
LARYRHAPELGPRIVFFSGGTGLRGVSRALVAFTHHSRHIITPFDSGGSSARLRQAFDMPAVGDLRNRLMALADQTVLGNPAIYDLFAFRYPEDEPSERLVDALDRMVAGDDARVREIPEPLRSIVCNHLRFFRDAMPSDFDLRGAAIGNLVLAGGYLNQGRALDSVLFLFSQLVEVRGIVRPVVDRDLHLVADLEDGRRVVGQHRITGRSQEGPSGRIERLFLSGSADAPEPLRAPIPEAVDALIRTSELICYPVGSFYTSLIATLLPAGVSDAIAATTVPKVYVPNPGLDPEEVGMTIVDKVETLLRYLSEGTSEPVPRERLLHFVLLDREGYGLDTDTVRAIETLGVQVIDTPLVSEERAGYLDEQLLSAALVSLV